ncbi:MAG TPA: LD-carboxypeptidase [Myxococcota bacterium]
MPALLKPHAVRIGATLGIAAPGGAVDSDLLQAGVALLEGCGFRIRMRDDVHARHRYLAGDDARRAGELAELVADPKVEAILVARGGYGCDRIIPRLDAAAFRAARKPLVGYSDVTALLLWQRRCAGLVGFHGPMLERGADVDPAVLDALIGALAGAPAAPLRGTPRSGGAATGRLVGGSLTLVAASIGTSWEIDTRGAILLLEDRFERPYRIDRMLQQLRGAGKLEPLVAVGLGDFSSCVDERYPGLDAEQLVAEEIAPLGIPLVTGLPFGHVKENHPWPMGCRAKLDGDRGELRILERGVSVAP